MNNDYVADQVYNFTFLPGEQFSTPPFVTFTIVDDGVVEPLQSIQLDITTPNDTIFLQTRGLELRIIDNDG